MVKISKIPTILLYGGSRSKIAQMRGRTRVCTGVYCEVYEDVNPQS